MWFLGQRNDSVAGECHSAVGKDDRQTDGGLAFAVDDVDRRDGAVGRGLGVNRCDRCESDFEGPQVLLRKPGGQRATQVGHRQHSVSEDIGHAGTGGDVAVDVNGVVVTGCAGEQCQGGARDGRYSQRREFGANHDIGR